MKRGLIFFLGILTGIVITVIISLLLTNGNKAGVTYYDEPGAPLSIRTVKVFQCYRSGEALVSESGRGRISDQLYLLVSKDKSKAYYDGEIIKAPVGTDFRIVGVYSYETMSGTHSTIPAIAIVNRK